MAKRQAGERYALKILNALMTTDKALTTNQLCDIAGCERKTVYASIDCLEISGFNIEVVHGHIPGERYKQNEYRFVKICGM